MPLINLDNDKRLAALGWFVGIKPPATAPATIFPTNTINTILSKLTAFVTNNSIPNIASGVFTKFSNDFIAAISTQLTNWLASAIATPTRRVILDVVKEVLTPDSDAIEELTEHFWAHNNDNVAAFINKLLARGNI